MIERKEGKCLKVEGEKREKRPSRQEEVRAINGWGRRCEGQGHKKVGLV